MLKQIIVIFLLLATALVGAACQMESPEVDTSSLEALMEACYDEAKYTPSSYKRYTQAYADAEAFLRVEDQTESAYQEIYVKLTAAISTLHQKGDQAALKSKIAEAKAYEDNLTSYYDASIKTLVSALKTARAYVDNSEATAEMVDAVIKSISDGIAQLQVRADKSALAELVSLASSLDKNEYMNVDWTAFDTALSRAQGTLKKEAATEEEINAAQSELSGAIDLLIRKPDKTHLQALYDAAIAVDEALYSSATLQALDYARAVARDALCTDRAEQAEVDAIAATLEEAIQGLQYKITKKYTVTCTATMVYNNHVGNKWSYSTAINGYSFWKTYTLEEEAGIAIVAEATVCESDTVPDYGSARFDLVLQDGYTVSVEVTVYENRGAYAGNKAKWKLNYVVAEETKE